MSLIINERHIGPLILLELGPSLTARWVGELRETLERLLAQGHSQVLLDCGHIESVDSLGLGALVRSSVSIGHKGGKLGLVHPSVRLQEALALARLTTVLQCYESIGTALSSF